MVSLQALTADEGLGLRLSASTRGAVGDIRGHHVTDLDHPGRYLLPGDLVLTNGLWLDRREAAQWVADVASAGAAAIAFGLTDDLPQLPEDLERACADRGLPLVVVPSHLSFSTVIERFEALRPDLARAQLGRLRQLQQRLAGLTTHRDLLSLIQRETGVTCWVVGPGGRVAAGRPEPTDSGFRTAASRAARLGRIAESADAACTSFPIDHRGGSSFALVVGRRLADIPDDARLVIETVMPAMLIETAERRARDGMRGAHLSGLLEQVWAGGIGRHGYDTGLAGVDLDPHGPITVVASGNAPDILADAIDGIGDRCVCARFADVDVFVAEGDRPDLIDAAADLIAEAGVSAILGWGGVARGPDTLRGVLATALLACRIARARPPGDQVVRRPGGASYQALLESVDDRIRTAFATSLLAPLRAWDRDHGADLLVTLRALVDSNGKWRQAARELHIHHNTLRYRAERIRLLTGRDIDDPHGRIDFALALAIEPPGGT